MDNNSIYYLQCDDCSYSMPVDCFDEKYIGTPCPKCGVDMLTESDLKKGQALAAMFEALGVKLSPPKEDQASITFNPHGENLNITITAPKLKGQAND